MPHGHNLWGTTEQITHMIITLPKSSFTDKSDGGEDVAPSVGDKVDLSNVVGMVKGEDGDNLQVEITAVNGVQCCDDGAEEKDEPMDDAKMRSMMASQDEQE